ncbi:MAG: hypothetical protein RIE77_11245 [Phycisphaerales bacterium]|jgi:hypothetical protein
MRCRRTIRTLVVFVLLGTVATVLSSWAIHGTHWLIRDRTTDLRLLFLMSGIEPIPPQAWPAVRVDATPALRLRDTSVQPGSSGAQMGLGWLRERHEASSRSADAAIEGAVDEILWRTSTGWPWPALGSEDYAATGHRDGRMSILARTPRASLPGGLVVQSRLPIPLFAEFALPVLPLWPGFLLNTLFFGLLLFGASRTSGPIRRALRRRRGRRARCEDDRGGLDAEAACLECGAEAGARKATAPAVAT